MASGFLYVISAPSGAGKTSLVKALIGQSSDISVSISHTTRAMRPGEEGGRDYHFVDHETFDNMANNGEFLEYAKVFDNSYGTSRAGLEQQLLAGKDVILEIDWQGARQIREDMPECISIFILPPTIEALRHRLQGRGQDDEIIIKRRMRDALAETSHYKEFDYLVINDDFSRALADLQSIFSCMRLQQKRQSEQHAILLESLLDQG